MNTKVGKFQMQGRVQIGVIPGVSDNLDRLIEFYEWKRSLFIGDNTQLVGLVKSQWIKKKGFWFEYTEETSRKYV